ncbi:DUF2958 domain-containing protein [Sphingomonas immobilis]|uniref:DUF2958 domain-containing protein n=1 Tax=Sphingomonas immobilis TaxID=3063997 RepID=A0ABT9A173_9SPHN|nr:DUF2958 domain-containing protein [Sphingomonas sp. CA1-15]MDO7843583.1 DUF2958 domain-containing protein [Sphingomonas sp. CA1-15]
MELLTPVLRFALRANHIALRAAQRDATPEPDPVPVVKFFSPVSAATWLATELDADGDTLFGLADLGFGCPELGSFSLAEIASVRLPLGLAIERDIGFATRFPLSVWTEAAQRSGSIMAAAHVIDRLDAHLRAHPAAATPATQSQGGADAPDPDPLPPSDPEDG